MVFFKFSNFQLQLFCFRSPRFQFFIFQYFVRQTTNSVIRRLNFSHLVLNFQVRIPHLSTVEFQILIFRKSENKKFNRRNTSEEKSSQGIKQFRSIISRAGHM